jgi:glycerophosphoryl diester phosphodiesterase
MQNPFNKFNWIKTWIAFFLFFTLNMVVFTAIAFLVQPIWYDINNFLINALGLEWDWLVTIIIISFGLIFYGAILSFNLLKRSKNLREMSELSIKLPHKIISLLFIIIWNFMLYILVVEGGDELKVIGRQIENMSPILYIILIMSLGLSISASSKHILKYSHLMTQKKDVKAGIVLVLIVGGYLFGFFMPIMGVPVNVLSEDLPEKPLLMAHRGAAYLAPENTIIAGEVALEWGAVGWEVDISISYDGVLFLCHDTTLERTTNVEDIFPTRIQDDCTSFNMSELQQLDAGSWFVEGDPFKTIKDGFVTQADAENYRGESIPTFAEVLTFTGDNDLYLDIDAGRPPADHPYYEAYYDILLSQLNASGLGEKIMINSGDPLVVTMTTVGSAGTVEQILASGRDMINTHHGLTNDVFRAYDRANITVMVWTVDTPSRFSQLWCLGVDYVKTNALHLLIPLTEPTWTISKANYMLFWVILSGSSILLGIAGYVLLSKRDKLVEKKS